MAPPSRALLQIHLAVLLFGFAGLFGKWVPLSPTVLVFGRVVFAVPVLLLASALRRLPLAPPSRHSLVAFAALGLLLAVHWTTFFQSVQVSSVAIALITFATFPVFVAFLEPLLLNEPRRSSDLLLAGASLLGIIILVPTFDPGDATAQGVLWGIASGLTFALLSLLNRQYVRRHSSITIALYQDAFTAVLLLPVVVCQRPTVSVHDVLLLLALGVLCTAVAHALFIAGLHRVQARTASLIACLEPVYGTTFAALFLREMPSLRTLAGGFIVLGVAFWATLRAGEQARTG